MRKAKGPQFIRFFVPIVTVLQKLGGSGTVTEVIDLVIEKLNISEEEQSVTLKSGGSRVRNQVQWARLYLVKTGYLDSSTRGVWSLTKKGLSSKPAQIDPLKIFKSVQNGLIKGQKLETEKKTTVSDTDEEDVTEFSYRDELLNTVKNLPSSGFERLCQRLLRESGFQQVVVTGRSGDGGIDGHGILEVNPFVSFKVLFQCKKYQDSVSTSHIRDFRGAMMGRADKGIIITTGRFTMEAKKEARRDGVPPIELVDGEKLVDMFEQLELGLIPKKTFDVDIEFFDDFQK